MLCMKQALYVQSNAQAENENYGFINTQEIIALP